ncbi:hypothetical protein ACP4OV_027627 [Aristida adscensionis]
MGRAGAAATKKSKNGGKGVDDEEAAPRPPRALVPFEQVLATRGALRGRLAALGATAPWFVTEKPLTASDVDSNQARLLFSCKRETLARCPLTGCFTDLEMRRVEDKGDGLLVAALDRGGRSYDLTCKYLDSNHGYRFIGGWKKFLVDNGLVRDGHGGLRRLDARVELWAFRSPALPNAYEITTTTTKDKKEKKEKKKIYEETGHPDGALGLLLLHYDRGDDDDHRHEEEGGCVRQVEEGSTSAPPVAREDKLAVAAPTERATTMMTTDGMIAMYGKQIANAAIGMCSLRRNNASLELARVEDMDTTNS